MDSSLQSPELRSTQLRRALRGSFILPADMLKRIRRQEENLLKLTRRVSWHVAPCAFCRGVKQVQIPGWWLTRIFRGQGNKWTRVVIALLAEHGCPQIVSRLRMFSILRAPHLFMDSGEIKLKRFLGKHIHLALTTFLFIIHHAEEFFS